MSQKFEYASTCAQATPDDGYVDVEPPVCPKGDGWELVGNHVTVDPSMVPLRAWMFWFWRRPAQGHAEQPQVGCGPVEQDDPIRAHIAVTTAAMKRAEAAEGKLSAADSHMRTEMCRAMHAEKRVRELEAQLAMVREERDAENRAAGDAEKHALDKGVLCENLEKRAEAAEKRCAQLESDRDEWKQQHENALACWRTDNATLAEQRDKARRVARELAGAAMIDGMYDADGLIEIALAYPEQKPSDEGGT